MLRKISTALFILAGFQVFNACTTCQTQKSKDELTFPDSLVSDAPLKLSEELVGDVVQNISSPV